MLEGNILKNCNVLNMECLLYKRALIFAESVCWKDYFFKKGDFNMVRSIDLKSALIGGFVVAMIVFLAGAVDNVPSVRYGRFQMETNDNYAFILDSATGQAWSEMFPDPQSHVVVVPDPNFYAPKIILPSTTGH
jgi:hypothetical protein